MSRNWKLPRPGDSEFTTLLTEGAATRENICLQSEDLSTSWINYQSVDTQNEGTAPDGSNTANKLADDSATGTGQAAVQQGATTAISTAYTYSVFLKADQLSWGYVDVQGMAAQSIFAFFDLANGVLGATTGANNDDQGIEDCGNGWYRCWISFTSDSVDTTCSLGIFVADGDNDSTVDRDGTSSIFVWGAQLEVGTSPTFYIPTTTVARTITGMTATGNFQDDVHTALETVLETTGSIDDLWKRYKSLT